MGGASVACRKYHHSDSPPTPSLSHSPSSTDSSSGMTFIDANLPRSQFFPFGIPDKVHPQSLDIPAAPYTYAAQPQPMFDIDPTSGLSFPSYALHGVDIDLRIRQLGQA